MSSVLGETGPASFRSQQIRFNDVFQTLCVHMTVGFSGGKNASNFSYEHSYIDILIHCWLWCALVGGEMPQSSRAAALVS